jgi:hypothetical protein
VDGAVLNDEGRAELAALRRRAFGPDADILGDPAALERLRELEASTLPTPAATRSATPEVQAAHAEPASPLPSIGAMPARAPATARFAARRPGRVASALAAGVVIAAVGGTIGWEAAQPHPDRILVADDTHYTPVGEDTDLWLKEMYGVTGALRGHEPYGHVHVWTGIARNGSECIVLMIGAADTVATSCSPRPLPASADLFIFPGWTPQYIGLDLPAGSVVRFVQSGDDVEVWTAIMPTSPPAR